MGFCCDKAIMKKQRNSRMEQEADTLRRAIMVENWMEKQSSLASSLNFNNNSTSNSSSNSTSSACADSCSFYKERSRRPKPVQSMKCMQFDRKIIDQENPKPKPKQKPEGSFTKTKLKASKIYGELKKVKQPISPGGRFTSFLNSIFSSGNAKKVNVCTVKAMEDVNFDRKSKSTCSRSCVSNANTPPPSSKGSIIPSSSKGGIINNHGIKRSVRFYPVSIIVDEDCRPCGHKCVYEDDPSLLTSLKDRVLMKKNEIGVGTFLGNKGISEFPTDFSPNHDNDDDDEDEDDAFSYSSSDLFELDHLNGIGRYREELPVYETTNLKNNKVIGKGLLF